MESLRTFEASVLPLEGDIIAVFRQMPLEGLLSSIIQLLRSPGLHCQLNVQACN